METVRTRIVVVGAGVAGIAVGAQLRRHGIDDFVIVERGLQFGGTWRDNVYPGVECDVQSHLYSFSFRPNPFWSKTFAGGAEIQQYLLDVVEAEGLGSKAIFDSPVDDVRWNQDAATWTVSTPARRIEGDYVVLATGTLADAKMPSLPGASDFIGTLVHSAQWDPALDLSGRRVAVIGTGASAIQLVPAIAATVEHLSVFQRTAPWIVPRFDEPYTSAQQQMWHKMPDTMSDYRQFLYWLHEARFPERIRIPAAIDRMTGIADAHRSNQIVDPHLAELTRPHYQIGCKRILQSNLWYPTLQLPNVSLVPHAADALHAGGVVDTTGTEHRVDTVIMCSGFETGTLPISHAVVGPGGQRLSDTWTDTGAQAYGGMSIAGFPNLFMVNGPHVGLGFGSIIFMIETQANFVAQALANVSSDIRTMTVDPHYQQQFINQYTVRAADTVWLRGGCDSFYLDAHGRFASLWPDFMTQYRQQFAAFDPKHYVTT